jgi:hypothetical protein
MEFWFGELHTGAFRLTEVGHVWSELKILVLGDWEMAKDGRNWARYFVPGGEWLDSIPEERFGPFQRGRSSKYGTPSRPDEK